MNLSDRLTELRSQLDEVKAKSADIDAAKVYEELASKLTSYNEVEENKNTRLCLKKKGVIVKSLENDARMVSIPAKKILERFEATPNHMSITQGTAFNRVVVELEKFNTLQKISLKNDWKEHCKGMFIEFIPDNVTVEIPNTPDNEVSLRTWATAYNNYLDISREVPSDPIMIENVQKAADKLKEIYGQFNRNVPEDVANFMNGVKNGTATLQLLTPTVLEYLHKKTLLDKYRVSPRGIAYGSRNG